MSDEQIKYMVDRFLGWRLPENFNPDAGISFKRNFNENTPWPMKHEPTGTNLLDATQAEAMIRYLVEGMPAQQPASTVPEGLEQECDELSEHITCKIQSLLTDKYTNSFRIAHGIIRQELAAFVRAALAESEGRVRALEIELGCSVNDAKGIIFDLKQQVAKAREDARSENIKVRHAFQSIENLAHQAWTDKKNIRELFERIEKIAIEQQAALRLTAPGRSGK